MALPPAFKKPNDYFEECIAFLKKYKYLYIFPNTDILVQEVLEEIEIGNLENWDVFDKNFELPSDNFLDDFLIKLERLTVYHNAFVETKDLEDSVKVPLSPKKRHEIVYLAKEVRDVCRESDCDVVVDFGAGLGYLDQIIFETTKLNVLGLECNTSHYVEAKKRQSKYHPNSTGNVKYIKHTINEKSNSQIEEYLHDKFLNFNGFCITGLHACADLTVVALDLFLKMEKAKAMVIMPCCYHKMEQDVGKFENFPLSNCLKKVFEKENGVEFMGVPFLRLGAQPPCLVEDNLEDSVFNLLARAVLQLYASSRKLKMYPTKFLLGVLGFNSLEVRRNNILLTSVCKIMRGQSDCPELIGQVVRLFVPSVPRITLRPRNRLLFAAPKARTVSRKQSPLVRALYRLNELLASAPDLDIFASDWRTVCRECLRYCEAMDRNNCRLKRNKRKAVKTKSMERNFENYINDARTGFQLIHNEENTSAINEDSPNGKKSLIDLEELQSTWREISNSKVRKKAAIFVLLQNRMQPIIENLILYDRIVYLNENGLNNCKVKRIVNEKISPRCLALLASKQ